MVSGQPSSAQLLSADRLRRRLGLALSQNHFFPDHHQAEQRPYRNARLALGTLRMIVDSLVS
jgi:hypothetical protein